MRFWRELSVVGGKWGLAILGGLTTVLAVAVYVGTRDVSLTAALTFAFLFLATLGSAHEFWEERNVAQGEIKEIENTPESRIDAVLRQALEVRESLVHKSEVLSEQEQRVLVMTLIVEALSVVREYAPAYADDLVTEPTEGAGTAQLLGVAKKYFGVLSAVRKQL